MKLDVNNIEHNLIKKQLSRLSYAYKQSSDENVKKIVKEQVYFELSKIKNFGEVFRQDFANCQMQSLHEIESLVSKMFNRINILKLPNIEKSLLKKEIKLNERFINKIHKDFSEKANEVSLTYYSQQINEKFVIIFYKNNQYFINVSDVSKSKTNQKMLCHFCNNFRFFNEIIFISHSVRKKSEYSTVGVYCCLDYHKCNLDILEIKKLDDYINYKNKIL